MKTQQELFELIQLIVEVDEVVDKDKSAIQSLKKIKKKNLARRVIKAKKEYGINIPIMELKDKIKQYIEEDNCHQS